MINKIYLAGGCFWGTEKFLSEIEGVISTETGYANGRTQNPTYEDVCMENTGHAETVEVNYETDIINLTDLLNEFYKTINPTSYNRQGNDTGTQYRAGIYYTDEEQLNEIQNSIDKLQKNYIKPIAIEISPIYNYYRAEEYHQKYLNKHPEGYCHIPKSLFKTK